MSAHDTPSSGRVVWEGRGRTASESTLHQRAGQVDYDLRFGWAILRTAEGCAYCVGRRGAAHKRRSASRSSRGA
jgi:hypothetical protein